MYYIWVSKNTNKTNKIKQKSTKQKVNMDRKCSEFSLEQRI